MQARRLHRLALVFVALFAILVAGSLFPVQPLDPGWIMRVTAGIVNASTLPLLALAVLAAAGMLDSSDAAIQRRYQAFCRLAGVAVLGYLLLIPVNIYAGFSARADLAPQVRRLADAERKLGSLRQAVRAAGSTSDLNTRLQRLGGPALESTSLTGPLPQIKAEVNAALDAAADQIGRERAALGAVSPLRMAPQLLSTTLTCLAFAWGFAIFSQGSGFGGSLLDTWKQRLRALLDLSKWRIDLRKRFSRWNRDRNRRRYARQADSRRRKFAGRQGRWSVLMRRLRAVFGRVSPGATRRPTEGDSRPVERREVGGRALDGRAVDRRGQTRRSDGDQGSG